MASETLDPVPFPTGHGHQNRSWLNGVMALMATIARRNECLPQHPTPMLCSMPRASCTTPPPLFSPLPSPILSDTPCIYPTLSRSHCRPPFHFIPHTSGTFAHRVPQTGSSACFGFPLIDTNPSLMARSHPLCPLEHEDYPPVGNAAVRQTVANPMRCRRNCTETENPFTWNGLIAACRSFAYICNFDVSSTTRTSRQAVGLAVCYAITLRGRSRVLCLEWMPARLGRQENLSTLPFVPALRVCRSSTCIFRWAARSASILHL